MQIKEHEHTKRHPTTNKLKADKNNYENNETARLKNWKTNQRKKTISVHLVSTCPTDGY